MYHLRLHRQQKPLATTMSSRQLLKQRWQLTNEDQYRSKKPKADTSLMEMLEECTDISTNIRSRGMNKAKCMTESHLKTIIQAPGSKGKKCKYQNRTKEMQTKRLMLMQNQREEGRGTDINSGPKRCRQRSRRQCRA